MAEAAKAGQVVNGLERIGGGLPVSALGRVTALVATIKGRVMAMPAGQRRWLGIAVLLVSAAVAGMLWYSGRTDWRTLYTGLDGKDVQQIAQELAAAQIAYEVTEDGGGVRVSSDLMDKARMEIAAKGMPQSGRMGFELFDKPNWVGSEFDEKVNYQRAMEGELEHTIGTLAVVKSARVHVVMPQASMFVGEARTAKASVVLKLRRSSMTPEQADSIRNLVAGAIENLSPGDVTLVDSDGKVNLNVKTQDAVAGDAERGLEAKLVAMLEPTAGRDNVRATVNVSYDEGSEEHTDEVYDPTQVATVSIDRSEQTTNAPAKPAGIPGTVSNTPGAAAAGSAAAAGPSAQAAAATPAIPPLMQVGAAQKDPGLPVYPQTAAGATQSTKEERGSYAVTKHLSHFEEGPGRVRRLTAAIVVNDRMGTEGAGKLQHAVWKPRSVDEMRRLEELAQAAVGFEAKRGDQVVIENVSFSSNVPEVAAPALQKALDETGEVLREQPGLAKMLGAGALILLLTLVVVRPMVRQIGLVLNPPALVLPTAEAAAALTTGEADAVDEAEAAKALAEPKRKAPPAFDKARGSKQAQVIHEHVSEQIRLDPMQSTRLLKSWIGEIGEDKD
jgi:flagellar M-ring protein FliF